MAKETVYGKYTYNNRVRGSVTPAIKNKITRQVTETGVSESSIVAAALVEYFDRREKQPPQSKHSY